MKFFAYKLNDKQGVGVVVKESHYSLTNYDGKFTSLDEVVSNYDQLKQTVERFVESDQIENYKLQQPIEFLPILQAPEKIICVGLNYKKHAEESNMAIPTHPVLFNKFANSLAAHNEEIPLPFDSNENDYEAELAIIIGKETKNVEKDEALNYVFGYANANDLSSRDLQFRTNQWLLGKALDKFCQIGPYLVTADEVGNPNELQIKTIYNNEVVQNSNTSDMIFYCDEIISYISKYLTLKPGDIILTGTPEGVLFGLPEETRQYMKKDDEVIIEIEKLGQLKNVLV